MFGDNPATTHGKNSVKLSTLCENLDNERKPITEHLRNKGDIPYYGASGIVDYVAEYIFDETLLLISEDGANLVSRNMPIAFSITGKSWVNNHVHILRFKNYKLQKYVESYINNIDLSEYINKNANPKLTQEKLNSIMIYMPNDTTCTNLRDLAIIDVLSSTGIRVGELVNLNIADVDFEKRECVVMGKGNKQRKVYFDARTKIHLYEYIASRHDETKALFVSLNNPHNRLSIRGIETILHKVGSNLKSTKVHPHKFRRTLATKAIDKGMPIEQVQVLLGHSQIDTTLRYAMVNQNNVKASHHKYIG